MKIIELKRRRKSLYGLQTDVELDPKLYGADSDPTGLIALDISTCDEYGLKNGMEITDEFLSKVIEASHYNRAKKRALWYLERGDVSKKQLIEKLKRAFPASAAQKAADRMEELGLIDDRRYAEMLANSLVNTKKVSPKMAAYMMTAKGIERDLAGEMTEAIEVDEVELIKSIIERKYIGKLGTEKELNRVINALARRGFSFSDIRTALKAYDSNTQLFED